MRQAEDRAHREGATKELSMRTSCVPRPPLVHNIMYTLFQVALVRQAEDQAHRKGVTKELSMRTSCVPRPLLYTTLSIRFFRLRWCARQRTEPIAKEPQRPSMCTSCVLKALLTIAGNEMESKRLALKI